MPPDWRAAWAVAKGLIHHLTERMGWPASCYRGFDCLDGLVALDDVPREDGRFEPDTAVAAATRRLAEMLVACRVVPIERLLTSIAEDANVPIDLFLATLGGALHRRGRFYDAARVLDTRLVALLRPLWAGWERPDQPITVAEAYRGHRIIVYQGRYYGCHQGISVHKLEFLRGPLRTSAGTRPHRPWPWQRHPVYTSDHFLDVLAMIDTAVPEPSRHD